MEEGHLRCSEKKSEGHGQGEFYVKYAKKFINCTLGLCNIVIYRNAYNYTLFFFLCAGEPSS